MASCVQICISFILLCISFYGVASMVLNNNGVSGCTPVTSKHCAKYGFNSTSYPNFLGQMSTDFADSTLGAVLSQIKYCSIKRAKSELIACAIHVPLCVNGARVPPCNEDCLDVIHTCRVKDLPGLDMAPMICGIFPSQQSGNCIAMPKDETAHGISQSVK